MAGPLAVIAHLRTRAAGSTGISTGATMSSTTATPCWPSSTPPRFAAACCSATTPRQPRHGPAARSRSPHSHDLARPEATEPRDRRDALRGRPRVQLRCPRRGVGERRWSQRPRAIVPLPVSPRRRPRPFRGALRRVEV